MANAILTVKTMGKFGVNVDKDPLELNDNELVQSQNAIFDIQAGESALRKRAGLIAFNVLAASGSILGGFPLPGPNLSTGSTATVYIARSPIS